MKTSPTGPANAAGTEAIVLDSDTADSDNDAVVVETGETTPETHDDAEYKEPIAIDEEADRQAEQAKGKDQAGSSVSPPLVPTWVACRLTENPAYRIDRKTKKKQRSSSEKPSWTLSKRSGQRHFLVEQTEKPHIDGLSFSSDSPADTALHEGDRKGEGIVPLCETPCD